MLGVWISTVYNLDWPDKQSDSGNQKSELIKYYKDIKKKDINTVFFQVRPMGDSFYDSKYAPWSEYITGKQGERPNYDPLEFAIKEAKKENLSFHAWFNPFRISTSSKFNTDEYFSNLNDDNPIKGKEEWFVKYGNETWLDPGVPEVREYAIELIMEVVKNYDIDGVHLDDYFYPYPKERLIYDDSESYKLYNVNNLSLEDWRRENINNFICDLGRTIKKENSNMTFGISPFGIWKNGVEEGGSKTKGLSSYYDLYVDSKLWVEEEWVDYIAPQIYWKMDFEIANYKELVTWWSQVVKNRDVKLYIGQALYHTREENPWPMEEITNQIQYNNKNKEVDGSIFFRLKSLIES